VFLLDELDGNTCFSCFNAFCILHKYSQKTNMTKGPSTLGVSVKR
jgi:hypothetical protein